MRPPDQRKIKVGSWFEATATGRPAILVLLVGLVAALTAKALGIW